MMWGKKGWGLETEKITNHHRERFLFAFLRETRNTHTRAPTHTRAHTHTHVRTHTHTDTCARTHMHNARGGPTL